MPIHHFMAWGRSGVVLHNTMQCNASKHTQKSSMHVQAAAHLTPVATNEHPIRCKYAKADMPPWRQISTHTHAHGRIQSSTCCDKTCLGSCMPNGWR